MPSLHGLQVDTLLSITEEMFGAAERGEWEMVEVLEKRPAHPPEFDQVKTRLQAAMQQEMLRRYVVELQQKSTVEIR